MFKLRVLLLAVGVAASAASIHAPDRHRPSGRRAVMPTFKGDLVAAKKAEPKPPGAVDIAYKASFVATTTAWSTIVIRTITSNAPQGAMMPSMQHGLFARIGCFAVVPLLFSAYSTLAAASRMDSWDELGSTTCRRLNLALLTAGVGSALWVGFAPTITNLPGTNTAHAGWIQPGMTRTALLGAYGGMAALGGAVWARSLPDDVRKKPLSWPVRISDGVCKSLVTMSPANAKDPINVKYSVLSASFLILTAIQFGSHPLSVIPSWTGRRLARHYPAWTFLAAVTAFDLKEATEKGKLLVDSTAQTLSNGLYGFGAILTASTFGKVFLDPSFPESYHAVKMLPAWGTAGAAMVGLTLRPDKE